MRACDLMLAAPRDFAHPSHVLMPCPQARATLRALEDAKLAGLDYPLSDLRTLCTLCQVGGDGDLNRRSVAIRLGSHG